MKEHKSILFMICHLRAPARHPYFSSGLIYTKWNIHGIGSPVPTKLVCLQRFIFRLIIKMTEVEDGISLIFATTANNP